MVDLSRIRAVALDFDGTLLEPGEVVAEPTRAALRQAAAAGLRLATASGRSKRSQLGVLERNGLGAAAGVPHALTCDERTIWLLEDGEYRPHEPWNGPVRAAWERLAPLAVELMAGVSDQCRGEGLAVVDCVPPERLLERGLVQIVCETLEGAARFHELIVPAVAAASAELAVSRNSRWVHLILAGTGKGRTLAALAAAWGLAPRELLAVGDELNDLPMLDGSAGLAAAAVGNAVPAVKAAVRAAGGYVAEGEAGAGVVEILEAVRASIAAT